MTVDWKRGCGWFKDLGNDERGRQLVARAVGSTKEVALKRVRIRLVLIYQAESGTGVHVAVPFSFQHLLSWCFLLTYLRCREEDVEAGVSEDLEGGVFLEDVTCRLWALHSPIFSRCLENKLLYILCDIKRILRFNFKVSDTYISL